MSLYHEARKPLGLGLAAECLLAYRRLEDSIEAEVGALLEAEHFALIRSTLTSR